MLDERLVNIENRLTSSEGRLAGVAHRLTSVEAKVDRIEVKVDRLEVKVDRLEGKVDNLEGTVADLSRQMHVLHEDTIDNIKALAPDFAPIRREFTEADGKLREDIERRLIPLESIARRRHGRPER